MPQHDIHLGGWEPSQSAPPDDGALALRALRPPPASDSWGASDAGAAPVRLYRQSQNTDAQLARLADGLVLPPEVGDEFCGFRLIGDLGRGAFGRVYLALQGDLADRPVALKVSTACDAESQRLARLQHTHIVPIHSFHRAGPLQAVCMPYFGPTTLADVLDAIGRRDSLPASGKGLVSTLKSQRTRSAAPSADHAPAAPAPAPVAPSAVLDGKPAPAAGAQPDGPATLTTLRMLEGMTYVQAVLWIGARLAEGLAHAHERGVLHRDLKPANVLLTDEGQPMLLDFNLSEDLRQAGPAGARVGGTLPYMAPEHLAAYQGKPGAVDARSDLYALGVILYELLTGRHPFGRPDGSREGAVEQMILERQRLPAPARSLNPGVTPAVDSILRRCLAPDPARRYQAARELQEDLDRQRQHRPLRYAPEPSLRERAAKWLKRNPRAVTAWRVGAAAGVVLALLAAGLLWRGEQLARHDAADRLRQFRDDLTAARLLLGARAAEVDDLAEGRAAAQKALALFPAGDDGRPREASRLPNDEKDRLQAETGELLVLLASATGHSQAGPAGEGAAKRLDDVQEALRMNRLAEACYGADKAPRALWAQRAWLEGRLGHAEEAARLRERAAAAPVRDAWDEYLLARDQADDGRLADAADRLRAVAARQPDNFAVQFLMGNCCLDGFVRLGHEADAVGCYSACIALRPDFHPAYANRGLYRLRHGQYAEADADLSRAVELRPDRADYRLHRAEAREGLRRDQDAVDDLDAAEELGCKAPLLYYLRARAYQRLGRDASARSDIDKLLNQTPADEDGFVARGVARAGDGDVDGALKDFTEAIKINPNSASGLQDRASILANQLRRNEEALPPLDRLLELYPDFAQARGARAVVRARLGRRDEALDDLRKAREQNPDDGVVLFQAATVHALLAGDDGAGRAEAFRLLCQALQRGCGWNDLGLDPDLASLRKDARFDELAHTAKVLGRP